MPYSTLERYGGRTCTSSAAIHDNHGGVEYQIIRDQTDSYNPWNPVSDVALYPAENLWKNKNSGCADKINYRGVDLAQNKRFSMQISDKAVEKTSVSFAPEECGDNCKDTKDDYEYCFAPACSTVRPCIQDGKVKGSFPIVNYPL
jgi:hypothetical protein